jgi:hypothetical protein
MVVVLVGVALVVGVVAVVARLMANDTTEIDIDQARAAATSTVTPTTFPEGTPTIPPTGGDVVVYVYAMSGHEEIDAFTGARHEYPAETYLTIRSAGCGEVWRWQGIEERWSAWEVCDPQDLTVAGFDSFNEWLGVQDLQRYRCDDSVSYLPPSSGTGTWTFSCSTDGIRQETTAQVVGTEALEVGGDQVDTIHIHYVDTLSGDSTGGSETDRWIRVGEPLVVKEVSSTASAASSPIGTVNYTEEYTITLEVLDPMSR